MWPHRTWLGVLATDALIDHGGRLAPLAPATVEQLNAVLPPTWSQANPVDIIGDAPPERYQQAIDICLEDPDVDGVIVILTPQAMTAPTEVAKAVIESAKKSKKPKKGGSYVSGTVTNLTINQHTDGNAGIEASGSTAATFVAETVGTPSSISTTPSTPFSGGHAGSYCTVVSATSKKS